VVVRGSGVALKKVRMGLEPIAPKCLYGSEAFSAPTWPLPTTRHERVFLCLVR